MLQNFYGHCTYDVRLFHFEETTLHLQTNETNCMILLEYVTEKDYYSHTLVSVLLNCKVLGSLSNLISTQAIKFSCCQYLTNLSFLNEMVENESKFIFHSSSTQI